MITFANAQNHFPSEMSNNVSYENVEKVLNPPQKPTTINGIQIPSIFSFEIRKTASPRIIQLKVFAKKVPIGREFGKVIIANLPIR